MPARGSLNAPPIIPTNLSLQNELSKPETTSPALSHNTKTDLHSGSIEDLSLTSFPSLTGLRSQTRVAETESFTFGSGIAFADVRHATASLNASPLAALQAAWAVILATYTATQADVIFTTLIDCSANHTAHQPQEHAFLAVPTRVWLGNSQKWGPETIGSVLKQLTESNDLLLHQHKQPVVAAASRNGTLVALKSKECPEDDDSLLKISNGAIRGGELAISLVAWPDEAGFVQLKALYNDLVLKETSALVMLEQLEDVLAFIIANPAEPIAGSMTAVRSSLLSKLNEKPEEPTNPDPQGPRLHTQFEHTARDTPHRVAFEFRRDIQSESSRYNTTWTYEQLNDRAESFATYVNSRFGSLVDEIVPICMGRRPELYVAILGILKTGGAWCPIDPSFPARRRHNLIARAGARVLVVAERNPEDGCEGIPQGVEIVDVIREARSIADCGKMINAKVGSLAYLIWTSGTTGDPKGVPIHHEAAVTSMRALQRSIPVDVTGGIVRCLQFSQFTFDVFIQDLFYTWGVGGTVISSTRDVMLGSFAELVTRTNATHAHLTPAFAASVPRKQCPSLEIVTMIGEKLPQAVADDWSQGMRAFNTYGPAETAVVSTYRQFGAAGDQFQSGNIGYPLISVSAFVMHNDRLVMRQGIGELALGGAQLSKGYWNDVERSSGRFVWNEQCSRHLYMTGDMVRQLYNGSFEFVGRTDDLIKVQGIRIELSEIGFTLRSCHPLVEQVEVQYLDRQDRPSKLVIAFLAAPKLDKDQEPPGRLIESEESVKIAQSALLEAQKLLPDFMIPSVFLVVNHIPRTTSAKTDKAVLRDLYNSADLRAWEKSLVSGEKSKEAANWSTRESVLITAIVTLSGTSPDSITRASDLRSIGIDSIAATRLGPLLKAKGFSASIADVLHCQSLDDLCKMTNEYSNEDAAKAYDLDAFHNEWYIRVRNEIKRNDFFVAPALPLQESLLSESMQDASAYWSNVFLVLDDHVDIARLHEAWLQVVRVTEALRTGFIPSATVSEHNDNKSVTYLTFMQLIYRKAVIDWTNLKSPETGVHEVAAQRAAEVAKSRQKTSFRDPLLAITIFEQASKRIMMISIHHSIRDEVSLDFILDDVINNYDRFSEGFQQRPQLREALQLMLPTNAQMIQDEEFWSEALDDFIATDDANTWPDLTGKRIQIGDPATGWISHIQTLNLNSQDLQDAVLSFSASSVASLLRVAWGSILLEYLETDKIVFAETWSSRIDDLTLTDVVGPLMTALPVPFRAMGSARETVSALSEFQRRSRFHRSIHPRVVRKLLKRSENKSLYPAMFNFLPSLGEDHRIDHSSLWHEMDKILGLTVEHPLALNVAQAANGDLTIDVSASQNVMSSAHLAVLASQFEACVAMIIRFPDLPVTQLPSYFPENSLSVTSVPFSQNVRQAHKQNPTDWVDHNATVHPHWPAAQVVTALTNEGCKTESWNYAELRSAYRGVAAFISHSGCFNRTIAVCLDRRIEAYAVILGILASGNIYLPIDEDLPRDRKSFLLQDSSTSMLFTTTSLALTFSSTLTKSRVIYVDDNTYIERISKDHSLELPLHAEARDNAYLLYTSGSTGVPKGVLVGRGNLCSFIEGLSEFITPLIPGMRELPGNGKYLGLASRAFDVHIAEIFLAWRLGLAAVTASRTMLLDNLELALRELKITHASFVPSLIDQAGLDPANLPDLHYLGVGGEKMSKRVVDTWASNPNAALINAYGPTEMSIGCTAAEVTIESSLRNVGRPYGNSVAHVLVPGSNRYALRGVAGELCFTGDLVANGYHNRPDAKGFVDDFNGERMYRTGDIVRMMADDTLEYLRRDDDQTKVRGQRLELGEITEAIRATAVTLLGLQNFDVATLVAQHPKLSKPQLVSFVAPIRQSTRTSESPDKLSSASDHTIATRIQASCRDVLPAYMVPDAVIPLTRLPLAPSSGKADMKRLKAVYGNTPIANIMHNPSSPHSLPSEPSRRELTEAEEKVKSAIISSLAVDAVKVSPRTNIFRLGLDSLSAISLAIKMQKLGYDCTVSSVMREPSIEQLALLPRKVQDKEGTRDNISQTRSNFAGLEDRFRNAYSHNLNDSSIQAVKPCLPLQETLVAASLNHRSLPLYVNHVTLRLSTKTDLTRLYKAWCKIVANHDILRTCFQEFENAIVQIVRQYDESLSVYWQEIATRDPESASQFQQCKLATEIIAAIASKAPLRLTLFRPPSEDACSILLISIHHAIYDGESIAMILQELRMRLHSAVPPPHTPFDSMIEYVYSKNQEAAKKFWGDYLVDYKPDSVLDRADGLNENRDIGFFPTVDRTLTSSLTEIEDFSSSLSGTLTSTIQAVFGIVLAQTLKTRDVVFGVVLSGRTVPIENPQTIVAPCITTIPQRVNLNTASSSIVDIVKESQQGFVASLEFQHTALRYIHRWLGAERPLFNCLVTYVQKPDTKSSPYPDLWTETESSMPNDFPLSLEFEADHESGKIRAHCAFSPAFGDLGQAASLLENVDLLLGALIQREPVTVEELGIAKRDAVSISNLHVWDDTDWSPTELRIRRLAAEVCGTDAKEISKGASFFSLGIDSISAIRFAQRLRQSGLECSSADVMRHSCVAALAQEIDSLPPHINSPESLTSHSQDNSLKQIIPTIPILSPQDVVTDVYACTPLQSSMLTQTLGSDGRLYVHHHAVRFNSHIDLRKLKHSWECLTMMVEILRTTFHFANNSWLAAVHQESSDAWSEYGISSSISDSLTEITDHWGFQEETDFERPPWKTTILKTATQTVFVISMHHSLYDGESLDLLFHDLARLYKNMDLPLRAPFSDATRAMIQHNADAEAFWSQKLDHFENTETYLPQTSKDTSMMQIETTLKMNMGNVSRGCKELGVTIQTIALLAYAKNLACLFRCRDIVFGHVVGGRSLAVPGAEEIIGPLFNTVPFRIVFDKTFITNKAAAIEIQQSSGDSQPHQHASLGRIQQAWRQKVGDAHAKLFDALFVFQNSVKKESYPDGLWTPLTTGEAMDPTEYSMNFEFEHTEEEITLRVASRKGLLAQEQLQGWLTDFDRIFQDILECPQRSVMAFPSLLRSLPLADKSDKNRALLQEKPEPGPDLQSIQTALSVVSGFSLENIPLDASIFSLGLDSISAIQVAATCREQGYGVTVADVLQGLSLAGICRRFRERSSKQSKQVHTHSTLVSRDSRSKALKMAKVRDEDIEEVLPCLAGQLYHLGSWLESRRTMCEATWTYRCSKRLKVDDLKSAWRELRERHPVLRTSFVALSPNEVVQMILKPSALTHSSFKCIESPGDFKDRVVDEIKLESQDSFDLFSPPSRLCLIHGDSQDFVIFKLHHAIYDGWTIPTFVGDLAALCQGMQLPPPPLIGPFIHQTVRSLHSSFEKTYWLKSLQDSQPTLLRPPQNHQPIPDPTSPSILVTFKSALPKLHSLETYCQHTSTTLPTLILLAHARTLAHHTNIASPTFGLYQTGRSAPFTDIADLCFPCLNVTPVLIRDALALPALESARALQADLAERVEFEQSYLHEVLEWVGVGAQPLFNTFVNILSPNTARSTPSTNSSDSNPLFLPFQPPDLAHPTDASTTPTPIDALSLAHLYSSNLYLDVVRQLETDSVDFVIRCDSELMDEQTVRAFAGEIVHETQEILAEIGAEGKERKGKGEESKA